jgi:protein disulfide-isomerase
MKKQFAGILLMGLIIAFGCSRRPMQSQTDTSLPLTNSPPVDLNAAVAQANTQNKLVLLDFTGSDWCPPCMELHKEIFSRPEFQSYAESNLIFLTVDFPTKFRLPPDASATNDFLQTKFNIEGFPTLVAVNGQGKEIWRHLGFLNGGLTKLNTELATAKSKAQ